jgi:mRNA-degrading endonuclease RelE of RelBE toxin-antitoxin system
MRIELTSMARKSYIAAPAEVQKAFNKQVGFLAENLNHPSLHAKKYDESSDLWQGRVNRSWRFYFLIQNDIYIVTDVVRHPK